MDDDAMVKMLWLGGLNLVACVVKVCCDQWNIPIIKRTVGKVLKFKDLNLHVDP
jgi:hypothetical protein